MKLRLFAPGMRNANLSLLKQNMQIPFKWQVGEGLLTQLTFSVCVCVCVSVLYANTAVTDEVWDSNMFTASLLNVARLEGLCS